MDKSRDNSATMSFSLKYQNKKQWFKEELDKLETEYDTSMFSVEQDVTPAKRIKTNYDLFNNKIDLRDFEYVCKPYGAEVGELPANMTNRDIISGRIKAFLGMEMKRTFPWKAVALNPEATTRKEEEKYKRIKDYVVNEITAPIRQQLEIQAQEQSKGQKLSPEELQQIKAQIEEQTKTMTPEEVFRYMERKHQDPAEVQSEQLLQYLIIKEDIESKFIDGLKHGALSAREIYKLGIHRGDPELWLVNPLDFSCVKSSFSPFIEDSEKCVCIYRMTPSQILQKFGKELTEEDIERIYDAGEKYRADKLNESFFTFSEDSISRDEDSIRVVHGQWRAPRKIGFLSYLDENGEMQERIVHESYRLDLDAGDISIEWEWIPEIYEGYKILDDIYVGLRALPGQFKDIDNLYNQKLSYYGVIYDDMNSEETSLMDRLKQYQYYFNIIMYRIEMLLASDKGKKLLMNINAIPKSSGIDIKQWKYFLEASNIGWYDPTEEGLDYSDVNTIGKVLDLSLSSDINNYIQLAEYIKKQAGESVGLGDNVIGQIPPDAAVSNVRQNLIQTSYILEPYFQLHTLVKRNVLQGLIDIAKYSYTTSKKQKLSYILDDLSLKLLTLDLDLLDNSTIGIFVTNSIKTHETMEAIRQLAHAAMQNQTVEFSDIITILRQESVPEMEETLKVAEDKKRQHMEKMQQMEAEKAKELEQLKQQGRLQEHEMEKENIVLKETEKRKTIIAQTTITGASFNPDMDANDNGINDFIEIGIKEKALNINKDKLSLEKEKFLHQKEKDNKELKLKEKSLQNKSKN
jgi:hypothetical protein